MKKKSLRPLQTAPVQRQTTAATSSQSPAVTPLAWGYDDVSKFFYEPFAGDDAE